MIGRSVALTIGLFSCVLGLKAADTKADPTSDQIDKIIKTFTQKETEFAAARESYTYRQTSKITETEPAGRQLSDC